MASVPNNVPSTIGVPGGGVPGAAGAFLTQIVTSLNLWAGAVANAVNWLLAQNGQITPVQISNPQPGDVLTWNGSAWVNQQPAS